MKINLNNTYIFSLILILALQSCNAPKLVLKEAEINLPDSFSETPISDSINNKMLDWHNYFKDPNLTNLIDTALKNNQELNIVLQELRIGKNEVLAKSGEYLPFVDIGAGIGTEKAGRFTRDGAVEHNLEIDEGKEFPEPLGDFKIGAVASWEVDVWKKLRNSRDAQQLKFLAQNEGKNFLISNLVAELASSYYELNALDNLLQIINENAQIQEEALYKVKIQKQNAKANQLAVNRFEAQLLNTRNYQYSIQQKIVETENYINFLAGKYPAPVDRNPTGLDSISMGNILSGVPSQLLVNRPDIRQAELNLKAANLDVKVARADFYPKLDIAAGIGFKAFNPSFLFKPESLVYNIAGDLTAPLINKKAIKARYSSASAMQIQAVIKYEQIVLNAFTEVLNQLSKQDNLAKSLETKQKEVGILNESVNIANNLFNFAKADYVEVLLTQEEVLEAKMELVETKLLQLKTKVELYRTLGGGWM